MGANSEFSSETPNVSLYHSLFYAYVMILSTCVYSILLSSDCPIYTLEENSQTLDQHLLPSHNQRALYRNYCLLKTDWINT